MKWCLMIVVILLVPISAQAKRPAIGAQVNMIGAQFKEPQPPYVLRFQILADQNIESIRVAIWIAL